MAARLFLSGLLAAPLVAGHGLKHHRQANTTGIPSSVEHGINTECKSCPWSLCTNTVAYASDTEITLTCWTEGTEINGDNTWLETQAGCYVTQWDLIEYAGDYTIDLPYCGSVPQTITTGPSRTVYDTECNIIPSFVVKADHIKMYQQEVDLTLTCYTTAGYPVLGNSMWYRTISNCYVPEAQIEPVDDGLDSCGDIPFLEKKMRDPDPEVTAAGAEAQAIWVPPAAKSKNRRWLYTTQIGDDSADCTLTPDLHGPLYKTYDFGAYIIVQCATYGTNPAESDVIYLLTTDNCFVNDNRTDPQLIDDELRSERYPNCIEFTDTVS